MTQILHKFPDNGDFGQPIQEAELDYLTTLHAAQEAMAENYVGLLYYRQFPVLDNYELNCQL